MPPSSCQLRRVPSRHNGEGSDPRTRELECPRLCRGREAGKAEGCRRGKGSWRGRGSRGREGTGGGGRGS
eukprot:13641774-Alexandrium_andersonii.AAC.1